MTPAPVLATVPDHVRWWAEREPAREATVLGDIRWSYGELQARIDALARALLAAGITAGDRVATMQTPRPEWLAAMLAATSIGAIWVGANPRYRVGELLHVVTDARPALLLTRAWIGERDYAAELAELSAAAPAMRIVAFDGDPVPPGAEPMAAFLRAGERITDAALTAARARVTPSDPCMIVYTSGSTGAPKGALLSHRGVAAFARAQDALWPGASARVLNYFPINHVGCVNDVTAPALVGGGCVVFLETFDVARSLALMAAERITLWGSVPGVFAMQLGHPDFAGTDLSAVRLIVWEGAAMAPELIDRLLRLGPALATNYGMTGTTSAITALAPTRDRDLLADSVGGAFPGVEVRLVDADGREADAGEVQARSIQNLVGYWNNPDATAAALTHDGWFRTGDLAERRSDGRYRIVGRLKEMFKSGGYNVYPREVEAVLEAHPDVRAAAVVGIPDPVWDEVGVAFVEGAADPDTLTAWCRARLANYKVPKRIHVEPALPTLPIGKIDKPALAARARHREDI